MGSRPSSFPQVSQHSLLFLSQPEAPEDNDYECKNGKTQEEKKTRRVVILTAGEKKKNGNKKDQTETQGRGSWGDTKEVKARVWRRKEVEVKVE